MPHVADSPQTWLSLQSSGSQPVVPEKVTSYPLCYIYIMKGLDFSQKEEKKSGASE